MNLGESDVFFLLRSALLKYQNRLFPQTEDVGRCRVLSFLSLSLNSKKINTSIKDNNEI